MQLTLADTQATNRLGVAIAQAVDGHAVIALEGPLGAGKTTLVKGIGEGLGIAETISSPTFTMLNEYHSGRLPLFHVDLYRLKDFPATQAALGGSGLGLLWSELDELLATNCVLAIEWAEVICQYLPTDFLVVKVGYLAEGGRSVVLRGRGPSSKNLLRKVIAMFSYT